MEKQEQKYIFHISGMHCQSCVLMTESELKDLPHIKNAKSSLKNHKVEIEGEFGDKTETEIAEELTKVLEKHGYTLSTSPLSPSASSPWQGSKRKWTDFKIAILIALAFAALFIFLQKIGIVNFVNTDNLSYSAIFLIGIIASLSSCMAVVGGLLLSMSATFAKEGLKKTDRIKPQLLFHLGRIVSFFILGGVIGAIGSVFSLSISASFILSIVIGIVMLILGINLLDIFHFTKKFQIGMPKFISKRALGVSKLNHSLTPLLVGIATFFLPCGFTQSMQIYTLSTGNFLKGGLTMLVFALGTLPVLAIISFSSFNMKNNSKSGVFFKSAGLIVILFALFNLINSLVVVGVIPPIFNF